MSAAATRLLPIRAALCALLALSSTPPTPGACRKVRSAPASLPRPLRGKSCKWMPSCSLRNSRRAIRFSRSMTQPLPEPICPLNAARKPQFLRRTTNGSEQSRTGSREAAERGRGSQPIPVLTGEKATGEMRLCLSMLASASLIFYRVKPANCCHENVAQATKTHKRWSVVPTRRCPQRQKSSALQQDWQLNQSVARHSASGLRAKKGPSENGPVSGAPR